jgi:hypothetical protein
VPELAKRILDGNSEGKNPKINIEGIMAGNAWTYMPIDNFGAVFYWWSHGKKLCSYLEILLQLCSRRSMIVGYRVAIESPILEILVTLKVTYIVSCYFGRDLSRTYQDLQLQ